jgi:cyclophilin family peptidyl-prolyl cis-trans isomerase
LAEVREQGSADVQANYTTQAFALAVSGTTLGAVANQSTTIGVAVTFTLTSTDPIGDGVQYSIVDPSTLQPPAHVTIGINQSTGLVTLTPDAGFGGIINLLARVKSVDSPDDPANYSTQAFTLQVNSDVTLNPISNVQDPGDKSVLVPLTGSDDGGQAITYTATSSDPNVQVSIVSPTSPSLQLNVSGTDSAGNAFSGTLILHLFSDLAPNTVAQIESLVNSNFYNGLDFFRVIDGFMAQGAGTTSSGQDSGTTLDDEFNSSLTFTSPGLLAMANAGPDTADSEFFITAIDAAGNTTPITLSGMPQSLDFRYTIFGQLVSGFDTFEKIMSTPVQANANFQGEVSEPKNAITITSASIINDTQNAVLMVTAPATSDGNSATITVTGTNPTGQTSTQTFTAGVVTDTQVDPPFLGSVGDQKTAVGVPETFTLTSTDVSGGGVAYTVVDPSTFAAPANVTVSINQTTGVVTLTPTAGFSGTINLLAGVRAASATDTKTNYDTQAFTLTVENPTLGSVSNFETTGTTPATFTLTSSDPAGQGVVYTVVDPTTFAAPTNATVSIDQSTGIVTVTPNAGFVGVINLLAGVRESTAADAQANYNTQAFAVTANAASATIPLLGPISNQTTPVVTAVTFTLTSTDQTGNGVFYTVVDPTTFAAPANVTVSIDQATGNVTLTPAAGFTGTITLLAGVRDATADDVQANYNTEQFTLTVTAVAPNAPTGLAVDASSNTGPFDGNGYVTTDTPKLTVTAETGATVQFKLNGTVIATATETAPGSGVYSATLPSGQLAVGANAITAVVTDANGTSVDSTALSVIYAPDYSSGLYVVPGTPGASVQLTTDWTSRQAAYNDEIGYFIANSDGSVNGIAPGAAGYAQAALSSGHVLFAKGQVAGATQTITVQAGQVLVLYLVQNNTTANFLARNPSNQSKGNNKANAPLVFFSLAAANPDGKQHAQIVADPTTGLVQYAWEDLYGLGDSDFNDVVMKIQVATSTVDQSTQTPTLHAPGTGDKTVTVTGTLGAGKQSTAPGDIGVFFVDDPTGAIGNISPGSAGYTAAALASGNFQVLFASGTAAGTSQSITVPAGKYLAFYTITDGTTTNFMTANPTDSTSSGLPVALFSFDVANPNGVEHFSWTSPEHVQVDPSVTELHIMDQIFGTDKDFDDLTVDLSFAD